MRIFLCILFLASLPLVAAPQEMHFGDSEALYSRGKSAEIQKASPEGSLGYRWNVNPRKKSFIEVGATAPQNGLQISKMRPCVTFGFGF